MGKTELAQTEADFLEIKESYKKSIGEKLSGKR
jgi:hypothetical protein